MPDYRRGYVPGDSFFHPVNVSRRRECACALRKTIVRIRCPIRLRLRPGCCCPITRMCRLENTISPTVGVSSSGSSSSGTGATLTRPEWLDARRRKRNQSTFWQHRFWGHCIRDQADFCRPIDYIHWNPVKHGYVQRVNDWPCSSLHRYVKQGVLPGHWGSDIPLFVGDTFGE